jgi:hypothetical protein
MCEPNHSIVQYPDEDDRGPTATRIEALPEVKEGWFKEKLKQILRWFHLSRPGFGHSEAIGAVPILARTNFLPTDTKYEARWWDRRVVLDGAYHGHQFDKDEALACATEYANRVSIGSLQALRNFLEVSMRKSASMVLYVRRFLSDMLRKEGRDLLWAKVRLILGARAVADSRLNYQLITVADDKREAVIKAVIGFTRKRSLLVPEWSDDNKLWGLT